MREQISSDLIRIIVLVALLSGMLLLLGYISGAMFVGSWLNGLIGTAVCVLTLNILAFFEGDMILPSLPGICLVWLRRWRKQARL